MFTNIKQTLLAVGSTSLLSFGTLALASPTYAINFSLNDLQSKDSIGDASFSATTATVQSGTPNTIDAGGGDGSVENYLGTTPNDIATSLSIDPSNLQYGSAYKGTLTAQNGDSFSFNYNFSTTDSDRAFVKINNTITGLSGIGNFSSGSLTAGTYSIGFGVVDLYDGSGTSTLALSDSNLEQVPEPLTILTSLSGLGFGVGMIRRFRKKVEA